MVNEKGVFNVFVISLKSKLLKRVLLCAVFVSVVCCSLVVMRCALKTDNELSVKTVDLKINDTTSVLEFVSSLGWEVNETPDEIREIVIPTEFDDVYTNYNNIQLQQNYDLSRYAGERIKKWTFTIKNYPGYEGKEFIKINILVFDGEVIGGDVCSVKLDGFMHGFIKDDDFEK